MGIHKFSIKVLYTFIMKLTPISFSRLYELRQNGIKSLAAGKLFQKLRSRRLSDARDKKVNSDNLWDWRRLIPNEKETVQNERVPNVLSNSSRKRAAPLEIVGENGFARM